MDPVGRAKVFLGSLDELIPAEHQVRFLDKHKRQA
jgi:hypothetical protein